jgi:plasmid stabilization system protein ParE
MTRFAYSPEAAHDLEQLVDFLLQHDATAAIKTIDIITDAIALLTQHPLIGRPVEHGLRELVISRGKAGYLALYEFDEPHDVVIVLAVRHQREQDYH